MTFRPYLFFGRNCRQAFTRYQEIFGGDLQLMSSADAPPSEEMPPVEGEWIMHAMLADGDQVLMGSDDPTSDSFGPVQGMVVSYTATDADESKRIFDALSDGGTVTVPLGPTFFSPAFGMCTDAFGTPWMVDTAAPASS